MSACMGDNEMSLVSFDGLGIRHASSKEQEGWKMHPYGDTQHCSRTYMR